MARTDTDMTRDIAPAVKELIEMAEALYRETRDLSKPDAVHVIARRLLRAYVDGGNAGVTAMKDALEFITTEAPGSVQ
jgi:hypothetical protein